MSLQNYLILNTYSIILLVMISVYSYKRQALRPLKDKLFISLVRLTLFLLVADIFGRMDGYEGNFFYFLNHTGNFFLFLLNPVLPSLWLLYVYCQIYDQEVKFKNLAYPLLAINLFNVCLVIVSEFFGWFYYIDAENIYHRGPLFLIPAFLTFFLLAYSFFYIAVNRRKLKRNHYLSMLFFAIPPFICFIFQVFFYGVSLSLNSVVISLLIIFLNIQSHGLHTDYLTGINNRMKLETYLDEKVKTCSEHRTFSAILLDLDNFKNINDTFGHDTGDRALQISVELLSGCLRSNDFIARFGGDEFFIVLDTANPKDLEDIIGRINQATTKYNLTDQLPYKLEFSMGYAIYDFKLGMCVQEFQKQVDLLMYKNKQMRKNGHFEKSKSINIA